MRGSTFSKTAIAIAAGAFSMAVAGPAHAQESSKIVVGGQAFDAKHPEGFCSPQGEQIGIAEYVASLDKMNSTLLHLFRCAPDDENYLVIKIDRNAPVLPFPKSLVIAEVGKAMESQFGKSEIQRGLDLAESSVDNETGGDLKLTAGQLAYSGKDEECAYLEGSNDVTDPTGTVTVIYGSCLTPVGQRVIAIHSYATLGDGVSIAELKARSKAMALNISPAD